MKRETLEKALNQISDEHIAEAAQPKKRRLPLWIPAVAATLALVILAGVIAQPFLLPKNDPAPGSSMPPLPESAYLRYLAAAPTYPEMAAYPDESMLEGEYSEEKYQAYDLAFRNWHNSQKAQYDQPEGYADSAEAFFSQITASLLSGEDGQNMACSPVNVYMALAMLAEVTEGESRQQILDALGADSIEALRTQAGHVWNAHYCADNATTLTLANSLWLDQDLEYKDATVQTLASDYYASVLQGQLGSEEMNEALRSWINEQTGGLLQQQAAGLEMDPATILALASTVYYRCKWDPESRFYEENNTQGIFHSPHTDWTVTYMNKTLEYGPYYWGKHYSAVYLNLEDGSRMWLILPDEGYTPADLLAQDIIGTVLNNQQESKQVIVNLSLPKFDVSTNLKLESAMKALGMVDVFSSAADFSGILQPGTANAGLSCASHATRVVIDEEGLTASAYTVMMEAGGAPPPTEEVDLVLDRPFLFLVESRDGLPLFAGVVNEP